MSTSHHKALILDAKFGKFSIKQIETPKPGPGELLVKIEAVGLNPVDWKIQKHGIFVEDYPAIIGTDIAGVVNDIGEGVSGFKKGDRVLYQGSWSIEKAGFQEYNLADAEITAKIPEGLSYEEAATIPVCIAAACVGLYNPKPHGGGLVPPLEHSTRGKYAGKPLVVIGGAGSVGQFAIQLGKLSGFSPIITTASPKHESLLKSFGATHIIDRHLPLSSLSDEIGKLTTSSIDVVFDAVSSPETQQAGYDLLAQGGQMITIVPFDVKTAEGKEVVLILGVWTLPDTRELGVRFYSKLSELIKEGSIRPNRVEVIPGGLNGIVGGLKRLAAGQVSGSKLVVRPGETV